jgi:hypothetical protein
VKGRLLFASVCAATLVAWTILSPVCERKCGSGTTLVLNQCLGPNIDVPNQSSPGGNGGTRGTGANAASDAGHTGAAGDASIVSDAQTFDRMEVIESMKT